MKNHPTPALQSQDIFGELRARLDDAARLLARSASAEAADTLELLRARFADLQEQCAEAFAAGRKKVAAGAKYADESIRDKPYQSLAIALGVGVLVGLFLARPRK